MSTDYWIWGAIAIVALILWKETNISQYISEFSTAAQENFRG
jgi:hypothetical protein